MNLSLNPYCSYCGREIKFSPSIGRTDSDTLMFCDILCAKLYNDYVERVDFDFDRFTSDYHKTTSKLVRKLYEKCRNMMFEELPTYTPYRDDLTREEMRTMYEILFLK